MDKRRIIVSDDNNHDDSWRAINCHDSICSLAVPRPLILSHVNHTEFELQYDTI